MRSKVIVRKTNPENVLEDIEKIMEMGGIQDLARDKVTILKDNISWHFPFLSANTTPWQLEGTIKSLKKAGFKEIVAVHNNTVVTDPYKGGKLNRLQPIYKKYGIKELYNFIEADIKWIRYKPKGKMLVLDQIYRDGIMIPEYFLDKNIIHLPTMKCHIYTTTTGAMKNAFGGLLNTKRHYTHSVIHETLVDLLQIQKEIHSGIFTVMDGTICGNGPGPRTMIPEEKDYMLASKDSVAIDAVAAKMMGFDPMAIPYIKFAHERGLGIGKFEDIEIIGDDITGVNFRFSVGDNLASKIGDLLWFSSLRKIQKIFFKTPLVYLFIFGSFFYHDYLWWPIKGKKIQRNIYQNTKWGRLFQEYPIEV